MVGIPSSRSRESSQDIGVQSVLSENQVSWNHWQVACGLGVLEYLRSGRLEEKRGPGELLQGKPAVDSEEVIVILLGHGE